MLGYSVQHLRSGQRRRLLQHHNQNVDFL